jgi:hypothetical protein
MFLRFRHEYIPRQIAVNITRFNRYAFPGVNKILISARTRARDEKQDCR